ncbi:hypothetical protein [Nocardioides sp. CER19]|uniref:hypothetical protein n=1 Tax=Nocardioides sp. CER19 TaxID=3038538 RepID=UPI00244D2A99|nr:hypothetical protein [Nocardioides sp. CER19]MDH2414334.1 hypothetical protein [Nocardioides sp. CER19]
MLKPYVSVVVLTFPSDAVSALDVLRKALLRFVERQHARNGAELVADGLAEQVPVDEAGLEQTAERADVQITVDAFAYRKETRPGWATKDSPYVDTTHSLCTWVARENWVAIGCDGTIESKLQKWLDTPPRPAFRRVPAGVINATLLSGDAKNLWLRGAHGRRRTKADSKTLSGQSVGEALNPLDDSTFALGSARAHVSVAPEFTALTGIVGTTPRKSKVWFSSTQTFAEFRDTCLDLLRALARAYADGAEDDHPFPLLATEARDLAGVAGAYELTWCDPDDLPAADVSDDLLDAYQTLNRSTIIVTGGTDARFTASVGLDGRVGGNLRCTPSVTNSRVDLAFGFDGEPTDVTQVRPVLDALSFTQLLTIHYESGHSVTQEAVYKSKIEDHEFRSWRWESFDGYDVTREKPPTSVAQDIHDAIGSGDNSLFTWVLQHFGKRGYLTCDDGSNEVADFVLLADDGELALIHVKGANSLSPNRQISASSLEVVTGQAIKNLRHLDAERLSLALARAPVASPAVWLYGNREANRNDMIDLLRARSARDPSTVFIVQPHITEAARLRALGPSGSRFELHRLRLVEMLLNHARGGAVGLGSDLVAVGDSLHVPASPSTTGG